jgi:hypothetical protein
VKRRFAVVAAPLFAAAIVAGPARASTGVVPIVARHVLIPVNTNHSQNWSGYNQGSIEKGKLFTEVSGNWTVPVPTQHKAGQAEYSSDWVGVGGGCVDAGCTIGDTTLIQTGTEQDVSKSGAKSYLAWYELIPLPEIQITTMTVHGGDTMHADVAEVVPGSNLWSITIKDVTTGQSFSIQTPYSSSHATAEWIEERPTLISTGGTTLAPLPRLTQPRFDLATANGAPAALNASEEIQMVTSGGAILTRPSSPDPDTDGFNDCTYANRCATPTT